MNTPDQMREPWQLKKEIPIALIVAVLLQTGAAFYWAASIEGKINAVDMRAQANRRDIAAMDGRQDKIGEVVIRMDESLKAIRATLSKIEKKLER